MSIVHFRLDHRLIHGQVALAWSKVTNPNHIIIANDVVCKDELQKSLLKMAAPKQVRVSIHEVDKVIAYLNRGLQPNERVFLLVNNTSDALKLIQNVDAIKEINIGNMTKKEGSEKLTEKIFVTEEEKTDIQEMIDNGALVYFQVLPNDGKEDFKDILNRRV